MLCYLLMMFSGIDLLWLEMFMIDWFDFVVEFLCCLFRGWVFQYLNVSIYMVMMVFVVYVGDVGDYVECCFF